ncbi:receptor activity-modifying protein 2 isoform X2 [Scleropages formosus]|uniref:Receptor (G protein-coupled) activity modifying protein 2 n=1 Tax=Scleropages formosus TaxID=113540 RepID=A0A8C9SLB8_SCLFO|nr:receptor activity-modifying protein 1-like isoform X2 [Scleropages formosus]
MRIALSFLGIFLSFAGFIQGNMNATKGCWNCSQSCDELYHVCNSFFHNNISSTMMECYTTVTIKFCYEAFEVNLTNISQSGQCMWNNIKSSYNNFTLCTETIADCLRIPWPNKFVEDTFVQIHAKYLRDCIMTELSDPPPSIVFALVMTPICLIPIIVVLVVLKTKNGDGAS